MRLVKLSLVIALLFSVCFVYAQTTITVNVENITTEDYVIVVTFNQDVAPSNAEPTTFEVLNGSDVHPVYEFDEDDVNLESITCTIKTGPSTPVGYIDHYNWLTQVSVAPSNIFQCLGFDSVDDYEEFEFKIY